MSKYEIGQMALVRYADKEGNKLWEHLVATEVYDNMTTFIYRDGSAFAEYYPKDKEGKIDFNKDEIKLEPLTKDGRPVFSKRSFFGLGSYTFKPTTKGR